MIIVERQEDAVAVAARMTVPALAHGVNCQGVMGKGFAKTVRESWPELYAGYRQVCECGLLAPGGFYAWQSPRGGWVWNLASQDRPGPHARLDWVEQAVAAMMRHAHSLGIEQVASVRIGCGIGGLDWPQVRERLARIDTPVRLIACSLDA